MSIEVACLPPLLFTLRFQLHICQNQRQEGMRMAPVQVEAVEVDTEVLMIKEDGTQGTGNALMRKKHDCLLRTPHTWVGHD